MAKKPNKARKTTAYTRLRGLGPERMATIEYRMLRGDGPVLVARLIQEEWGEFQDVKHHTLVKQLARYKESELSNQMALLKDSPDAEKRTEILDKLDKQLDVAQEMAELIGIQKKRLKKGLDFEEKMPTLSKQLNMEVRLLKDTLNDLGKLQLETGILHRAAHRLDARVTHETTERGYQNLEFEKDQQDKISKATEQALKELGLLGWTDTVDAEDAEWSAVDDATDNPDQ